MSDFHPFFVHFPIALYVTALGMELLRLWRKEIPRFISTILVVGGAVGGLAAGVTGDLAERHAESIPMIHDALENHETMGNLMVWLGIIGGLVLVIMTLKKKSGGVVKWLILVILFAGVLVTGYQGGVLVQQYGAGTVLVK